MGLVVSKWKRRKNTMDESLKQRAFEMFREGRSVNQVANELFKKHWAAAKKLHNEFIGVTDTKGKSTPAAAPEEPENDPETFDLTVSVEVRKFDAIWKTLDLQEKANALQHVLNEKYV
jgi:hypothetical protein